MPRSAASSPRCEPLRAGGWSADRGEGFVGRGNSDNNQRAPRKEAGLSSSLGEGMGKSCCHCEGGRHAALPRRTLKGNESRFKAADS